jgi:uncharacterized protein
LFVLHDIKELPSQRIPEDVQVVVCGHSHQPDITRNADGLLVINPGSAGPRRFKLPVSAGELVIGDDGRLEPRLVRLIK